jgi:D,D-heptose 1,7-bisphosphate phosphatase
MAIALRPAVFLDRDGTINWDPGYLSKPEQMRLLEGAGEALRELEVAGLERVVVSNQSGVARGLILAADLPKIHTRLNQLLKPFQTQLLHFELCQHAPQDRCACRKPSPKLLQNAASQLHLDLARSYMVGDKLSDVQAGKNAGVRASILVLTGCGEETREELRALGPEEQPTFIARDLRAAAAWIRSDAGS